MVRRIATQSVTISKLLVVDSRVEFIGGYNIGELYASGSWRDTHLKIEGSEAREMENAFADLWNANRTEDLSAVYPESGRKWRPNAILHRNDPDMGIFPIRTVYLESIDRAESHIYMTNVYFIPDPALRTALKQAVNRGVDVQVLLPWNSNHVTADWLGRRWFRELLDSGVRIFGYKDIMIHSKTATIDGCVVNRRHREHRPLFPDRQLRSEPGDLRQRARPLDGRHVRARQDQRLRADPARSGSDDRYRQRSPNGH